MVPVPTGSWGDSRLLVPKGNDRNNKGYTCWNGIDPQLQDLLVCAVEIVHYIIKQRGGGGGGEEGEGGGGPHHSFNVASISDNIRSDQLYNSKTNWIG